MRPEVVEVLGKRHAVKWDQDLGRDCGDVHLSRNEIRISKDLGPGEERETLLHETFHAIDYAIGVGLTEKQVRAMSVGLFSLLSGNPELRAYLFGGSYV